MKHNNRAAAFQKPTKKVAPLPAHKYINDMAPNNTMILAITRKGNDSSKSIEYDRLERQEERHARCVDQRSTANYRALGINQ